MEQLGGWVTVQVMLMSGIGTVGWWYFRIISLNPLVVPINDASYIAFFTHFLCLSFDQLEHFSKGCLGCVIQISDFSSLANNCKQYWLVMMILKVMPIKDDEKNRANLSKKRFWFFIKPAREAKRRACALRALGLLLYSRILQWEGGRLFDRSAGFFYENSCNSGTESRKIVPKVGN